MDFQTPHNVAEYMASMIPDKAGTILEPHPGKGNLVSAVKSKGEVVAPSRYEDIPKDARFDWVIMNPPFTPSVKCYETFFEILNISDNIIALMPWLIIINSQQRAKQIIEFGLPSITHLPRKIFPGARVQCCILELRKGYKGETIFKLF